MLPIPTSDHLPAELANIDTPTLRSQLAQALELSAHHLVRLAAIWAELERRGENLQNLRTGLAVYLPQIAAGKVDAELIVRFAGQHTLLNRMAALPISEQRRLLSSGVLSVAEQISTGIQVREIPLSHLSAVQARLAIDDGRVRPPQEQEALLISEGGPVKRRRRRVKYEDIPGALELIETCHPEATELVQALRAAIGADQPPQSV